jgi:hypothetical protein
VQKNASYPILKNEHPRTREAEMPAIVPGYAEKVILGEGARHQAIQCADCGVMAVT